MKAKFDVILSNGHYRVVMTFPRGDRYVHDHKFALNELANADRFKNKIIRHINEGGEVMFGYWSEIEPEFGSVAYELYMNPSFFGNHR